MQQPRRWDILCRVVDNLGDIGFCWRLAADLAARGQQVRLWADDASALAWMAPGGAAGVTVFDWHAAQGDIDPGDVVIEAFGCDLPAGFVRRMARSRPPPLWINLEYLSAERQAERNHGLHSPQAFGPAAGLVKWFFYPGFTAGTGGLVHEAGLLARRQRFDRAAWLRSRGIGRLPGERLVSLFCYEHAALDALLAAFAGEPTCVLAAAGTPAAQLEALLGPTWRRGDLRALPLPRLTQHDYDHLLWSCDLNIVRGEDSFVRAQWAGVPFIWHIYRQADGAHEAKLAAFLDIFLSDAEPAVAAAVNAVMATWNQLAPADAVSSAWPVLPGWRAHATGWRDRLEAQPDLATRLLGFAPAAG